MKLLRFLFHCALVFGGAYLAGRLCNDLILLYPSLSTELTLIKIVAMTGVLATSFLRLVREAGALLGQPVPSAADHVISPAREPEALPDLEHAQRLVYQVPHRNYLAPAGIALALYGMWQIAAFGGPLQLCLAYDVLMLVIVVGCVQLWLLKIEISGGQFAYQSFVRRSHPLSAISAIEFKTPANSTVFFSDSSSVKLGYWLSNFSTLLTDLEHLTGVAIRRT